MPADTEPQNRPANRLAREASPYLLQHAHNPVDWRPWGREAFEEARRRDVPIFLSIGYATCYWCHVMERESFESDEIARMLNDRFVCIKVDREERPEVDEVYMAATVMMTGHGGWPMSVFLEPARLRPFWCGTYFPPEPRHSMPSFKQVIEGMGEAWKSQRSDVLEQADRLAAAVAEQLGARQEPVPLSAGHVQRAVSDLLRIADQTHGGFGRAPKFPQPVFTEFLLDVREALDSATRIGVDTIVRLTLDRMARGGMRDQIGGGFHRYSVDAHWVVPHFEKMLYDNGQLASLYARAASLFHDPACARTARQVLDDTLREMRLECGAFASAQDAEVDGREGLNYLWTPEQVDRALDNPDDAEFIKAVYALDRGTNFQDPHHPNDPPANVLHMVDTTENLADRFGTTTEAFLQRVDRINKVLLDARAHRPAPATDDKVIAAWNGLMIAGLVAGAEALDEPRYAQAAADAAEFILREMVSEDGRLFRTWRNGSRGVDGVLDDHAAMIHALLALHNARHLLPDHADTEASTHLDAALRLLAQARTRFADSQTGGYFDTDADREDLFVRTRATHDGPVPSPASMMIHNLIDLADATGEPEFLQEAMRALHAVSHAVNESPVGALHSTRALLRLLRRHDAPSHPEIIQAATTEPGAATAPPDDAAERGQFTPVEVFADAERLEVGEGTPAAMQVFIRIAPGYHIVAADPGEQDSPLVPLRVHTVGGTGLAVYADYPQGEPYDAAPQGLGRPMVYTGELEFTVALEREGEWTGRPLLALTYQACTDTECRLPTTVELDVAVDPV